MKTTCSNETCMSYDKVIENERRICWYCGSVMNEVKSETKTGEAELTMTVKQILRLEVVQEEKLYGGLELDMFQPLATLVSDLSDYITVRQYVKDFNNDGRSRSVSVLVFNEQPFAIYQYRGKGSYESEYIFDEEVYKEALKFIFFDQIETSTIPSGVKDKEYIIRNYNQGLFTIEKNTIISK